ncbi:MAG TPA: DUF1365 family protein [Solirubrobacter sp.]|nr:DUF1365 family protein [Solirubrobacter sp.]
MYAGTIRHRRFAVRSHAFKHRLALAYMDIDHAPARFLSRADVARLAGEPLAGAIHVLAHPRGFNPVSFYYCFAGGDLRWLIAEVTNTPWGERHAYVLRGRAGTLDKALHVSPFMGMDHEYVVRATAPGETLSLHIESRRGGRVAFDATLNLHRRPLRRRALLASSVRVLPLIYAHGIALMLKGIPQFPHPEASR